MQKRYIIAVGVMIALWCAFMAYRHYKKTHDRSTYAEKTDEQMLEIARNSPRGALVLIGRALERYRRKNHAYPQSLAALYPEYLANKSVVEATDCYYELRDNDFFLSTTFTVNEKRVVAYLDEDLRPQIEEGVMVATPSPVAKAKVLKKTERVSRPEELEASHRSGLALARENFLKALRQKRMDVTSVSLPDRNEARLIASVQPELTSIDDSEVELDLESNLSLKYLVWKGKDGVLGFSNIRYPPLETLSIYAVGRWYNVKVPLPLRQGSFSQEGEIAKRKKDPDMIASNFNRSCLVWKDRHGTLGFGNAQYPEKDFVSVLDTGEWVKIKRPRTAVESSVKKEHKGEASKSLESIASEFSARYLVWKDRHGTVGFGNVQYPEKDLVSVFGTDNWVHVDRHPATEDDGVEEKHIIQEARSLDTIASAFGTRYLVWKDRHGTVGFGNVQYPEIDKVSQVHVNGGWERIVN